VAALPLPRPRAPRRLPPALLVAAVLLAEVVLAAAVPGRPIVVAAALAGAIALLAIWRPRLIALPVVASLAFLPVYMSPSAGPLTLEPTVCGLWLVAFAVGVRLLAGEGGLRPTLLDGAVAAFATMLFLSVAVGGSDASDLVHHAFTWFGPYLGVRLLLQRHPDPRAIALTLVAAAVAAVPLLVVEVATGSNPFLPLARAGGAFEIWGDQQARLGADRAEGAWGHPIALSMFLGTTALLALVGGVLAPAGRRRAAWLTGALVLLVALALTLSRTGWIVLVVGAVLAAAALAPVHRRRLAGLALAAVLLVLAASTALPEVVPSPLALFSGDSAEVDDSGDYRRWLFRQALQPGTLGAFGQPERPLSQALGGDDASIDNAYLVIAQDWGVLAMVGFLLIAGALLVELWRLRGAGMAAALPAVALANLAGLGFVALITQQQVLVWVLIGAVAGIAAARRPGAPA